MFVLAAFCYIGVIGGLIAASIFGARVSARVLGVPDFAWYDSRLASASLVRRFGVRFASVFTAYFYCSLLLGASLLVGGKSEPSTTVRVLAGPARTAGMQDGDRVLSIDGDAVDGWESLRALVRRKPSVEQSIEVERGGARLTLHVTPSAAGRIAIETVEKQVPIGLSEAAGYGFRAPFKIMSETLHAVTGRALGRERADFVSPIGIVSESSSRRSAVLPFFAVLASYFLPFLVGVQLFEGGAWLLFEKTHPLAADGERSIWRLARLQHALMLSLAAWVVVLTFELMHAIGVAFVVPLLLLIMPMALAIVPLVWFTALRLWGKGAAIASIGATLLIPFVFFPVAIALLLRARRELRDNRFRVGLLIVAPLSD